MDPFRYGLRRIASPGGPIVTLEQAKLNLSIDDDDYDTMLTELIEQASEYLRQRTDCSLTSVQWEMTIDRFPRGEKWIQLPCWPVQAIDEIRYIDEAGDEQTIDSSQIVLRLDDNGRGRIALKDWAAWPTTRSTPDAVQIEFTAGWTGASDVPAQWSRAILLLVAWWFEQREAGSFDSPQNIPYGVDAIIDSAATVDDFGDFEL